MTWPTGMTGNAGGSSSIVSEVGAATSGVVGAAIAGGAAGVSWTTVSGADFWQPATTVDAARTARR